MSRRNYGAIAQIISNVLGGTHYFHQTVDAFCSLFKDQSILFDEGKFRDACRNTQSFTGYKPEKEKKIEPPKETKKSTDVIERLVDYQRHQDYGYTEAVERMNEKFKKLSKKTKKNSARM